MVFAEMQNRQPAYTGILASSKGEMRIKRMIALLEFVRYLISLYVWVIIFGAILSWLVAFNIINPYNQFARSLILGVHAVTEPLLGPIRRILPNLGAIDISPIVLIIALWGVQGVVIGYCDRGFLMPLFCN